MAATETWGAPMDPRDIWGLQMNCLGTSYKIAENILEKLPGDGPKFLFDRKTSENAAPLIYIGLQRTYEKWTCMFEKLLRRWSAQPMMAKPFV